jgi:hypothetical protein
MGHCFDFDTIVELMAKKYGESEDTIKDNLSDYLDRAGSGKLCNYVSYECEAAWIGLDCEDMENDETLAMFKERTLDLMEASIGFRPKSANWINDTIES